MRDLKELLRLGRNIPLGGMSDSPKIPAGTLTVLLFSPHPDDECIVGALPLRLMRESGVRIVNVAVTQGSRRDRRIARWKELKNACKWLGWDLVGTVEGGFDNINPKGRTADSSGWKRAIERTREILAHEQPAAVFFPHAADWNGTHMGVHLLVMDALAGMPGGFECRAVETEFWAPMERPNLMVETSEDILADLMAGIACHVGEVERNPYHLSLPAWMQDNVRRGGELVGGQGAVAPDFAFATLYCVRHWAKGRLDEAWPDGRILSASDDPISVISG